MNKTLYFFLLLGGLFTIFYCTELGPVGDKPAQVRMIPVVADTCWIEQGIDAVPEGDAIRLEWIPSEEEYVASYRVYRSTLREGPYETAGISAAGDSAFVDSGVVPNMRYYYYVQALSEDGISSDPSDTVDYRLLEKAVGLIPGGVIAGFGGLFSWEDPNNEAYYIIRVEESGTGNRIWIGRKNSGYTGGREEAEFNFDGNAAQPILQNGLEYRWRVDVGSAQENCGSESQWTIFKIQ